MRKKGPVSVIVAVLVAVCAFAIHYKLQRFHISNVRGKTAAQIEKEFGTPWYDSLHFGSDSRAKFRYGYYDWEGQRHIVIFYNGIADSTRTCDQSWR